MLPSKRNTMKMKLFFTPLLFIVYIASSCMGLFLIKAAPEWRSINFVAGVGLYGFGAILWLVILRLLPLSLAFPIAAGGLIICTILTGKIFLHEELTALQLAGAAFIIAGIFLTVAK
jgi:drug/metabolite transporter (DMT)-like permease